MTTASLIEKATAIVQQKITDTKKATPGPYRVGDDQHVAGVMKDDKCVYCDRFPLTWAGKRDINGTRMLAHVHTGETWWEHGIYAERDDGHLCIVNDTDEYGYMDAADAQNIVNHSPDVMVPLWEWMLETLGQWKVIDLNHGPTHLQVQQQIINTLAESLARTICGGDE